jgi:erythromycin esterase
MKRQLIAVLAIAALAATASARPRPTRPPANDASAAWLRQHAAPLRSVEPSQDDADLQPILPLVANARVIALTDATHGTHELFALKQRLIPYLVAHANVRTIALEAPYADFERVREYVLDGTGDPSLLIQSSDYFFWDTEELLGLIRWARAWNAAGNPPIEIVGIDPFHANVTAARVMDFIGRVDPEVAQSAATAYDCMLRYGSNAYGYPMTTADYRESCHASVASVRLSIEAKRTAYAAVASASDVEDAIHAARNVELGEELVASGLMDRDRGMAEDVEWLAERSGAGTVLVWGHNEHFGKQPYTFYDASGTLSSGAMLTSRYGSRYVAIGSVLGSGTFNAVEYDESIGRIRPVPVDAATSDDWAAFFAQGAASPLLIPLRAPLPSWLSQKRAMRVAGSGVVSPVQSMKVLTENLASRFDAVIYLDSSTPTRLRHFPEIGN